MEKRSGTQHNIKTVKASEARQHFSEITNEVFRGETRILIEKSGVPVAAVVSAQDLEALVRREQEREELSQLLDEMSEPFKDISEEEVEREVMAAVLRARRELRDERAAIEAARRDRNSS